MTSSAIGRVSATERQPSTCTTVRFWVEDDVRIRPFDIVKIAHVGRAGGKAQSYTYALVQDLMYLSDSAGHLANYVSSDFGDMDVEPFNARLGTTVAEAEVLYNTEDVELPVRDGSEVEWADAEGIREALGLGALSKPIPAGFLRVSNGTEVPIELESAYLLGPEGAHLNIAGISGLATKTSYAMFLLSSIQQSLEQDVSIIIFNVKGDDLLYIDEPNPDLAKVGDDWGRCGLKATPFHDVTYLTPFANRPKNRYSESHVRADVMDRRVEQGSAFNYYYDVEAARPKLPLLFSDIDDPNSTMESMIHELPDIDAASWAEFRKKIEEFTQKGGSRKDISVMSWRKFNRLLRARTESDLFVEKGVVEPEKKRQMTIRDAVRHLKPGGVMVIDIQPLPDYLQCLVFGDVISTVYALKQGDEESEVSDKALGKVVIFADELNKFSPKTSRDSGRTLTQLLLEITERGRSLGVTLFGAEQFRSGVHDRVLGNCSTNVYGRTSPLEISKCPDYKYFPGAYRSAISRLPKGSLLLQHAVFKTDLVRVQFPFPAYLQVKR